MDPFRFLVDSPHVNPHNVAQLCAENAMTSTRLNREAATMVGSTVTDPMRRLVRLSVQAQPDTEPR